MQEQDTTKLMAIRKRYSLIATLSLLTIFLLIFTGSLKNYVDTYPPAERMPSFDQIYSAIKPLPSYLHRYLGFLLVVLLPATALPLFAMAKQSLLNARRFRTLAAALLLLGLACVVFGLVTGQMAAAHVVDLTAENVDPAHAAGDAILSTHFNLVSLSLGFVTVLILYGALLIHRETKRHSGKNQTKQDQEASEKATRTI